MSENLSSEDELREPEEIDREVLLDGIHTFRTDQGNHVSMAPQAGVAVYVKGEETGTAAYRALLDEMGVRPEYNPPAEPARPVGPEFDPIPRGEGHE